MLCKLEAVQKSSSSDIIDKYFIFEEEMKGQRETPEQKQLDWTTGKNILTIWEFLDYSLLVLVTLEKILILLLMYYYKSLFGNEKYNHFIRSLFNCPVYLFLLEGVRTRYRIKQLQFIFNFSLYALIFQNIYIMCLRWIIDIYITSTYV